MLSFVGLLVLWFVGGMESDWAAKLSVIRHLESFSIGVLDFEDVGYYILFTAAFLFMTIRWQEASRWK
jgi:ABC-2 type transport system permease protein